MNKFYDLQCQFIFDGKVSIKAESREQAEEFFKKHVGLVLGGNIHHTLMDEDIDWEFPVHPEKIVIPKDQED